MATMLAVLKMVTSRFFMVIPFSSRCSIVVMLFMLIGIIGVRQCDAS